VGILKETKAANARTHAQRAYAELHKVFVYRFLLAKSQLRAMSAPVVSCAEVIEAVEGEGWTFRSLTTHDDAFVMIFYRNG